MPPDYNDPFDKSNLLANPSAGYTRQAQLLSEQQTLAEQSAMGYLNQALGSAKEVSAEQGIAAALLAAVPTIGGYMMGKAIGGTDYGDVPYQMDLKKLAPTGAYAGGLAGSQIGAEAAGGYLGGIEKDILKNQDIYQKKSALESARASRLQTEADQMRGAGLSVESKIAMMPLEMQQYYQQQEIAKQKQLEVQAAGSAASLANQKAMLDYETQGQKSNPEIAKILEAQFKAAQTGDLRTFPSIPAELLQTVPPKEMKAVTDRESENRRIATQVATMQGGKSVQIAPTLAPKLAAADNILPGQERLRQLYNQAAQQLGPGFVQSFARKGLAALPANAQQEFLSTLGSVAMQMNRAVDPTPSDAGMQAQLKKLLGSVENGNFFEALDFEVKNARRLALSEVEPYTKGPFPNEQAIGLKKEYEKKWGMAPKLTEDEFIAKYLAEKRKAQ